MEEYPKFNKYTIISIILDLLTFSIPLYAIYFYSSAVLFGGTASFTNIEQQSVALFFVIALIINIITSYIFRTQFPHLSFRAVIALAATSGIIFFSFITDLYYYYLFK